MMKSQKRGTDLSIMIRMELYSLGKDPHKYDSKRLTIHDKEVLLKELRDKRKAKHS